LAQKIICKVNDPQAQQIHREVTERMLLALFINGLGGDAGKQTRYANPQSMQQALTIALSVYEAEKQEKFNESFYARFDESDLRDDHPAAPAMNAIVRVAHMTRASSCTSGQYHKHRHSNGKKTPVSEIDRNSRIKAALNCYEYQGVGRIAGDCPTGLRRKADFPNAPGRKIPSERSKRSRSPSNKPPPASEREVRRIVKHQ
jgi:hypothetical protein